MDNTANSRNSDQNIAIQQELKLKVARKEILNSVIPYAGFIFIIVFFTIVTRGKTVTVSNLTSLINQCFTITLIAVGASFVYAHGGFDFSIGGASGLAQLMGALLLQYLGTPIWMCVIFMIATTVLCSCCVATISLRLGVPVFVASLCVRSIAKGIVETACQDAEIILSYERFKFINNIEVKTIILLVVVAVGYYLFEYTRFGKHQKAIGGNINTARQAGIKVKKEIFLAYIFFGFCVGISSVFSLFRDCTVTAQSGSGIEFNIMIAIVLGGFPMNGGDRSKIPKAILGALTITALTNGLIIWGMDANLVSGFKGLLFLIIIALSYDRSNGKLVS